jgi:uncharacterized beta-barrel protein YwiB (DUF1934 family)
MIFEGHDIQFESRSVEPVQREEETVKGRRTKLVPRYGQSLDLIANRQEIKSHFQNSKPDVKIHYALESQGANSSLEYYPLAARASGDC